MPTLSSIINSEMNRVELRPIERNDNHLSVCVQYERNGRCQVSVHAGENNNNNNKNTKTTITGVSLLGSFPIKRQF